MSRVLQFTAVLALAFLIVGCAAPRQPMTPSELSTAGSTALEPDEAIVVVRLNYLTPGVAGGVLHFHYDGTQELRDKLFVRTPENWYPMFAIPTSLSGSPLLFRVKAGRFSFTQFNRGMYIGDLNKQLHAFTKPRTITYIGEINLQVDGARFSYRVTEDAATVDSLRNQYPALFAKYPQSTYLLTKDL